VFGCTPYGAKIVQGDGTLGPQAGGTATFGVMRSKEGSEPVKVADPLYGGRSFSRKLRASMSE
jgi:hypothetical protein